MKSFLKYFVVLALLCAGFKVTVTAIELSPGAENASRGSNLEQVLYRLMALPAGSVLARRPATESKEQLDTLIGQASANSELYALRAQEEERQLDFKAAEKDWRRASEISQNKQPALMSLADFYARRLEPREEVQTLLKVASLPSIGGDSYKPDSDQAAWLAIRRALHVASDAQLPADSRAAIYEAWTKRYPKATEPLQEYFDSLIRAKDLPGAHAIAARIHSAFPERLALELKTDSMLARLEQGDEAALRIYESQFSPLWPDDLRASYFALLSDAHQLRAFLADARNKSVANPTALDPVLRIFFYYEQQGKRDVAAEQLLALQSRRAASKTVWTAPELSIIAKLFARAADYDEAAHAYYSLYELPGAPNSDKSLAMASLIDLLLDVPEQNLAFGERDLSIYKNVATLDRHPGFLNGILSLLLNTTFPEDQYQTVSQTAIAYFHRAMAARLIEKMRHDFPGSTLLPSREAKLFSAYSVYGQHDATLRLAPPWLAVHKNSPKYTKIALLLAETYGTTKRVPQELAIYDGLLLKLGTASGHRPLGDVSDKDPTEGQGEVKASPARSPEYAQVLDLYVSRLTQLKRLTDAVALYRKEIDRNPNDPGIYERLALFVEQNHFDSDLEQTYQAAMKKFDGTTWPDKLARFYLRKRQTDAYQILAKDVTDRFDGSQLAQFISAVRPGPTFSVLVYREVNLYAHQRFPHNLVFVRNLLASYQAAGLVDTLAYEALLRENWYYDAGLRNEFFQYLSRTNKLVAELAALPKVDQAAQQKNTAALAMSAEGNAWLANFETAAPAFVALSGLSAGDDEHATRAISIQRSLSYASPTAFNAAVRLAEQRSKALPGDAAAATLVGELYADKELFVKAAPWWNKVAAMRPGAAGGYLDAATVFWDYYQFPDSLRLLEDGRRAAANPALYGYEAGAIRENQNDYHGALDEYLRAALVQRPAIKRRPPSSSQENDGDSAAESTQPEVGDFYSEAQNRLVELARRKQTSAEIEQRSAALAEAKPFNPAAFQLRLSLLEDQGRRADIHTLLTSALGNISDLEQLESIQSDSDRLGFDDVSVLALQRAVALNSDPVEKLSALLSIAKFYQSHQDLARSESEYATLLNENPNLLGIVRATTDFYWSGKQTKKAVATLEAAAGRSQNPYRDQFRREAAQKAADSRDFATARRLLDILLSADPYNGDLLASKAATYASEGDNKSLISFYGNQLDLLKNAILSDGERTQRAAGLRRGYINALVKAKQFDEALEQYEQLLNAFPEDESLTREMAHFAETNHIADRLTKYYAKATADSPRNYRWPMVLARLDTALRRYPEAVEALNKAVYVRPDRTDLFVAKADLETRLLRFDEAIKTYQKLYEATYHDSQYLSAQASLHARLGHNADCVRLLNASFVDAHPKELNGYVEVMSHLVNWHMYAEADQVYQTARPLIAAKNGDFQRLATLEGQTLIALRRPVEALEAVASVRRATADPKTPWSLQPQIESMGAAIDDFYTPEEKAAFEVKLDTPKAIGSEYNIYDVARASGFTDLTAKRLYRSAVAKPGVNWRNLEVLQSRRLLDGELAHQLETLAPMIPTRQADAMHAAMLSAYGRAGDLSNEIKLSQARLMAGAGLADPARYAQLLVQSHADLPATVRQLSALNPAAANQLTQELLALLPEDQAMAIVGARGSNLSSLWTHAYSALTALYFLSPQAASQFDATLGPRTVGTQLSAGKGGFLTGDVWFYYAARYGDYLTNEKDGRAADFRSAPLEAAPIASDSYVALGADEFEAGHAEAAMRAYDKALELSPDRADVHVLMAEVDHADKRLTESIAHLRTAFEILKKQVSRASDGEEYRETAKTALVRMNEYGAVKELRPVVDAMLAAHIKKNQSYQFLPFVEGILTHAADRKAALAWVLELTKVPDLSGLPDELLESVLISEPEKKPFYQVNIEIKSGATAKSVGEATAQAQESLQHALTAFATYLNKQGNPQEAWQIGHQIEPKAERPAALLLELAAKTGRLTELLSEYDSGAVDSPVGEQVLTVASLFAKDHADWSLQIREWEYQREMRADSAPASAYFGLAEVRIEQKRTNEALALLRDVTLSLGSPFENLAPAVTLLEKSGLKQNAIEYAREWQTAEPWNPEAAWAVARTTQDKGLLEALRKSDRAAYVLRAAAARELRESKSPVNGSTELDLLTHATISRQEASQPFFVLARLRAGLYAEAIAWKPLLREQRLALAETAFHNKQEDLGLAAWNSYNLPAEGIPWLHSSSLEKAMEPPADRSLGVEESVAAVLAKRQQYAAAVAVYNRMLTQSDDQALHARIEKLKAPVTAALKLQQLNRGRAPAIGVELTQAGIVKPKLTGGGE